MGGWAERDNFQPPVCPPHQEHQVRGEDLCRRQSNAKFQFTAITNDVLSFILSGRYGNRAPSSSTRIIKIAQKLGSIFRNGCGEAFLRLRERSETRVNLVVDRILPGQVAPNIRQGAPRRRSEELLAVLLDELDDPHSTLSALLGDGHFPEWGVFAVSGPR